MTKPSPAYARVSDVRGIIEKALEDNFGRLFRVQADRLMGALRDEGYAITREARAGACSCDVSSDPPTGHRPWCGMEPCQGNGCRYCQQPRTPGDPCRDCSEDGMATP